MPVNDEIRRRVQRAAAAHRRATVRAAATRADFAAAMKAARTDPYNLSVREVAALADVAIGTVQAAERGGWKA